MFGRVIVGFEGSESAHDALALGEALTEPTGAELVVARVVPWKQPKSPARERRAINELEEAARAVAGWPELVRGDDVAAGLEGLAAEVGADLIVVGSDGHGRPHRAVAGDVGLRLLRGSPCPVAVAPRRFRHRYASDVRTIALGYDASEESAAALPAVGELARLLEARVRLIAVEAAGVEKGLTERRLAEGLAALPAGIEGTAVLLPGEPAAVPLEEAATGIDLLVVGSVSSVLVHEAACPILVFPRGAPKVMTPRLLAAASAALSTSTAAGR